MEERKSICLEEDGPMSIEEFKEALPIYYETDNPIFFKRGGSGGDPSMIISFRNEIFRLIVFLGCGCNRSHVYSFDENHEFVHCSTKSELIKRIEGLTSLSGWYISEKDKTEIKEALYPKPTLKRKFSDIHFKSKEMKFNQ